MTAALKLRPPVTQDNSPLYRQEPRDVWQARLFYDRAQFATDWSRGLLAYVDNEFALSITQPIEYGWLEDFADSYERAEREAFEELQWFESEARLAVAGGRA